MPAYEKKCGTCERVFQKDDDFLKGTHQWRVCASGNLWFNCDCGSTLMLPRGKFPWYSPGAQMSGEAASLFNQMAELQALPHISTAVMELQTLLSNEEVEISDLAHSVKNDPFIASEVLKMFEKLKKVRDSSGSPTSSAGKLSLEHAITFIGRKELSQLVMVASMKEFKLKTEVFRSEGFWEHSFQVAAIAESLWTEFYGPADKDSAYLAGCLSNIGKIIAAIIYPEKCDQVSRILADPKTQTTWSEAEKKAGLYDHGTLGEIGAAFWGFPDFVFESLRFHHSTDSSDDLNNSALVHIVALSQIFSHWINGEPHRFDARSYEKEKRFFRIDESRSEELILRLRKKI
ncbi:MAG: HDOD domain-containing protein [Deltaproteobacteria bacterium]|nr:HDOD domain-containing protein [Deltaproteobacteria bacterium]